MTKIESVVVELGNDLLRKIEIDTLQISENCLRNCLHCSVSPDRVIETINMAHFKKYVLALARINEETGNDLIANYLHTSIDSDPLFHPELATIVETLIETTGKKFYFLTQGWYGINQFQKNAEWIANNPE